MQFLINQHIYNYLRVTIAFHLGFCKVISIFACFFSKMETILSAVALLSFFLFIFHGKAKFLLALILFVVTALSVVTPAVQVIASGRMEAYTYSGSLAGGINIVLDPMGALFICMISFTMLMGLLYAPGYLRNDHASVPFTSRSLHYFSYLWLYFAMLAISVIREGMPFLIAWEIMTLSSFILVIYYGRERNIIQAGINYLIQMHIGFLFLMAGFILVEAKTGIPGFDGLKLYLQQPGGQVAFWLFFVGFAVKAGFIPFHTWLPEAHPAAPTHVSGIMSGIMIKMGIFGILRIISCMSGDYMVPGVIILVLAVMSSLYGVMQAIFQHDLKRLLAWHSIENIGIIGIGIGAGMIGLGMHNQVLTFLGFAGGILHVLNHSLFKSLLFFSAGSVYAATGTRDINLLGGIMKKMPMTAGLFLLASIAISGLPPLNGFISEFLIFTGLFSGMASHQAFYVILFILSIAGLALTGGLAAFCFTKAFGITFLGVTRGKLHHTPVEAPWEMLLPQFVIGLIIVLIGVVPIFFIKWIGTVILASFNAGIPADMPMFSGRLFGLIGMISGLLIVLTLVLFLVRRLVLKGRSTQSGPTWGCGYTAGNPAMQYTSTSFASEYAKLSSPLISQKQHYTKIEEKDIFPDKRSYDVHSSDSLKEKAIDAPARFITGVMRRLAVLQTGKMQHYVLYALLFLITVLILSLFNLL